MKTDKELYQDIQEKVNFEPGVDPHNITFSTHNGIVTLNGSVKSYLEKHLLTRAVRRIDGVRGIANDVLIKPMSSASSTDAEIAASAVRILDWNVSLPKDKIKVTVENGKITLTGEVPWQYQRQYAEKVLRYLSGVIGIDNQIQIKPTVTISTSSTVKEKIRKEFERHAFIDAQNISVEILGDRITLKGQVQSWAEVKEASQIAWSIPGVSYVDNQIIIK